MTSNHSVLAAELAQIASEGALSVAPYLRKVARTVTSYETKRDLHDPVTVHDRETEELLRQFFGKAVPGSRFLGEEYGEQVLPGGPGQSGEAESAQQLGPRVRWIVDPIDGTANFASGSLYFGTSVGVELDGVMSAGAISIPSTEELFCADFENAWHIDGQGNRTPLRAQGPKTESESLLTTYYPSVRALNTQPEQSAQGLADLANAYMALRRTGAAALDLAQVAAGWQGAVLGAAFGPWDVAAGIHMIRVAGGSVLNLGREDQLPDGLRPALVATGANMDAPTARRILIELIRSAGPGI